MTVTLAEVANVRMGIARTGTGVGARRGDWELRIIESADIVGDLMPRRGIANDPD